MTEIVLKHPNDSGQKFEARFLPDKGMNLISYKLGDLEVIDQSTKEMFEKKFAGLGALIGPHFHRRKPHLIPKNLDEEKFPHIRYFKNDEVPDPFSHGVARYAPWQAVATEHTFRATLSGKNTWNGVSLSEIEGQNFEMQFNGSLTSKGLNLELTVSSDSDSVVGTHYYFFLPEGKGTVISQVQNHFIEKNEKKSLPKDWDVDSQNCLHYPLDPYTDYTFFPFPNPLSSKIILETQTHRLMTCYQSNCGENSWQLWHPQGSSFVCIEPLSSQDPRHPNLTVSSMRIQLDIIDKRSK